MSDNQEENQDATQDIITIGSTVDKPVKRLRLPTSLKGKNGHRWSSEPKAPRRTPKRNIVHIMQGPTNAVKEAFTSLDVFH